MLNYELLQKLHIIILITFSALILGAGFSQNQGKSKYSILHLSFLFPFWYGIFSLLFTHQASSASNIFLAETFLVLALLVLSKVKPKDYENSQTVVFILAPIILAILFYQKNITDNNYTQYILIGVMVAASLANLNSLKKSKGLESNLFWSYLLLLSSCILSSIMQSSYLLLLSLLLESASFTVFLMYICKSGYQRLNVKIIDAQKKLENFNRTVEMEVKKRVFEIQLSNDKLLTISKIDKLTGAYNKAAILELIESQALKKDNEFSILMFDIDMFKLINDNLGHIEGDKCIKKLSLIVKQSIRTIDSYGRYGGDEFIILLPNTSPLQARIIAERFRKKVEETNAPHFTVSIGIASFPGDATTTKQLVEKADEQLYISKGRGRNVVSYRNM